MENHQTQSKPADAEPTVKKLRRGTSKEARAIWKMVEEAAAKSPPWMRGHIKKIVAARFPISPNA
jgi:hypothetical protein